MTQHEAPSTWFVYIVSCADNSLYTGITTNIDRRIKEHNSLKTGAKYTRTRQPVKLAYYEMAENRSKAAKREYVLKKLTRADKLRLIEKQTLPK